MSKLVKCKDYGNAISKGAKKCMGMRSILLLVFVFVPALPLVSYAAFLFHISDTMTTDCLWTATLTEAEAIEEIQGTLGVSCKGVTDKDGVILVECKGNTGTQMYFFAPDEASCRDIRKSMMTIMGSSSSTNPPSSPSSKKSELEAAKNDLYKYAGEAHMSRDYSSTEAYSKSTAPSVDTDGIMQAQMGLKHLGYFQGKPNGVHDKHLTSALMDYQWTNKLVPDGVLDPELLKRITEDSFKK
jgi:hypothetical protein